VVQSLGALQIAHAAISNKDSHATESEKVVPLNVDEYDNDDIDVGGLFDDAGG
jgi:hypothetical protein